MKQRRQMNFCKGWNDCQAEFINQLENNKNRLRPMNQQSPFVRYHRNRLGISSSPSNQAELLLQTKNSATEGRIGYSQGANIYLQSLQEPEPGKTGNSGKKQRKIKVFGIAENKIRRQEYIPSPFDCQQQSQKNEQKDQMLIDSKLHIVDKSQIEEPSIDAAAANTGQYDENQLQKLLYFSGSSASLPNSEQPPNFNREQSIKTEEIDQFLQVQIPNKQTERNSSSIAASRINLQMKNTESSYIPQDLKARDQQNSRITQKSGFVKTALKNLEDKSKDKSELGENSKILQITQHPIHEHQHNLEFNAISPIPKKYDEILQASIDYDAAKELKLTSQPPPQQLKLPLRPVLPLPKKKQKIEKSPQNNIKSYFESYGSYGQQIEKMINKLEKVSDLKGKQKFIKRELQTLTHKKHQSVDSYESEEPPRKPKSYKTRDGHSPAQDYARTHMFAQSASNFFPSKVTEPQTRNEIQRDLQMKAVRVQKIINKFKEISQLISNDDTDFHQQGYKYHIERSQKNFKTEKSPNPLMFQSEKLVIQSMDLPNYSCKKTVSQPQIQLKIPEKMKGTLNESQQIESDSCTYKEIVPDSTSKNAQRSPIIPYYTNTVKTEKKTLQGLVERCQSRYDISLHAEKKCECSHAELAQEIARLNQKVQELQKAKQKQVRQVGSLNQPSTSSNKRKQIQEGKESPHQESSGSLLVPKQIQESIESIKAKISKQNPHICNNLQPISILKPISSVKEPAINLKNEQAKHSQIQTKRRVSKDLPPKPKNISKSPKLKNDVVKQNQFRQQIDVNTLKIGFPTIVCYLSNQSSENSIIKFGQSTYTKLFSFAVSRQKVKEWHLDEKAGFKIKKYEDCIHYYLHNSLNYHLICYFRGKLYFGQLKDPNSDSKHGFGYYSTQKYVYEGQFVLDKKQGKGTINYINGDMYQGNWRNGKKEGQGILINLAGDIYSGTFHNGKKNGQGQERLKNGDFYRGEFRDGKLEGQGKYWWCDGSVYQGGFKGGLLHGKGIWRSKENDCYEGEYRQNKKHGKGIYKWSNGMIFTGVFEADQQIAIKKQASPNTDRKNSRSGQRTMRNRQNSGKKH